MYVPIKSIPEAISEAQADLPHVQGSMLSIVHEQERKHRINRGAADLVTTMSHTSPNRNNWLVVLTTNKRHSSQNFLMWFRAQEGICGLQASSEGPYFLYTPHFLTRYRERSGHGAPAAIENLTTFFFRNPACAALRTGKEHLGFPAIIGAVPDGYVLGTTHEAEGYQRFRTFVSHEQAFPNQRKEWEGLEAVRQLQVRYPALFAQ